MWNCECGFVNEDGNHFCPQCGKMGLGQVKTSVNLSNWLVWCLAVFPAIVLLAALLEVLGWINLPEFVCTGIGYGFTFGILCADCAELKKYGYNLTKWKFFGMFLFPSIYLVARAKKVDKKYGPFITRIVLTLVVVVISIIFY